MDTIFWIMLLVGVSATLYWLMDWESHQDKDQ